MDKFTGRVWVLGDDIDTDIIIKIRLFNQKESVVDRITEKDPCK